MRQIFTFFSQDFCTFKGEKLYLIFLCVNKISCPFFVFAKENGIKNMDKSIKFLFKKRLAVKTILYFLF